MSLSNEYVVMKVYKNEKVLNGQIYVEEDDMDVDIYPNGFFDQGVMNVSIFKDTDIDFKCELNGKMYYSEQSTSEGRKVVCISDYVSWNDKIRVVW